MPDFIIVGQVSKTLGPGTFPISETLDQINGIRPGDILICTVCAAGDWAAQGDPFELDDAWLAAGSGGNLAFTDTLEGFTLEGTTGGFGTTSNQEPPPVVATPTQQFFGSSGWCFAGTGSDVISFTMSEPRSSYQNYRYCVISAIVLRGGPTFGNPQGTYLEYPYALINTGAVNYYFGGLNLAPPYNGLTPALAETTPEVLNFGFGPPVLILALVSPGQGPPTSPQCTLAGTEDGITWIGEFNFDPESPVAFHFDVPSESVSILYEVAFPLGTIPPLTTSCFNPATGPVPPGEVGEAYPGFQFVAHGGSEPYVWSSSSFPWNGLSFSDTGLLSGTPENPSLGYTFQVTVTDALGNSVKVTCAIPVVCP